MSGGQPTYHLIYDAAHGGFADWLPQLIPVVLIGAVMITVGFFGVVRPNAAGGGRPKSQTMRTVHRGFRIFWFVAVCAIFALVGVGIFLNAARFAVASRDGTCKQVEGVVTDYKVLKGVHFTVSGVRFDYSYAVISGGFSDEGWFSSPIQPGMQVRICYVPKASGSWNVIVRLEVAD